MLIELVKYIAYNINVIIEIPYENVIEIKGYLL